MFEQSFSDPMGAMMESALTLPRAVMKPAEPEISKAAPVEQANENKAVCLDNGIMTGGVVATDYAAIPYGDMGSLYITADIEQRFTPYAFTGVGTYTIPQKVQIAAGSGVVTTGGVLAENVHRNDSTTSIVNAVVEQKFQDALDTFIVTMFIDQGATEKTAADIAAVLTKWSATVAGDVSEVGKTGFSNFLFDTYGKTVAGVITELGLTSDLSAPVSDGYCEDTIHGIDPAVFASCDNDDSMEWNSCG